MPIRRPLAIEVADELAGQNLTSEGLAQVHKYGSSSAAVVIAKAFCNALAMLLRDNQGRKPIAPRIFPSVSELRSRDCVCGLEVGICKHTHLRRIEAIEFLFFRRTDRNDQVAEFHPRVHDYDCPSD